MAPETGVQLVGHSADAQPQPGQPCTPVGAVRLQGPPLLLLAAVELELLLVELVVLVLFDVLLLVVFDVLLLVELLLLASVPVVPPVFDDDVEPPAPFMPGSTQKPLKHASGASHAPPAVHSQPSAPTRQGLPSLSTASPLPIAQE